MPECSRLKKLVVFTFLVVRMDASCISFARDTYNVHDTTKVVGFHYQISTDTSLLNHRNPMCGATVSSFFFHNRIAKRVDLIAINQKTTLTRALSSVHI